MRKFSIILFLSLFVLNNPVVAHSIHLDIAKNAPTVLVKAYYLQTSPVAGADVIIYAPGEEKPYQTGRTDRRGHFVFVPSAAGDWRLEIDDEGGHKNKVSINVDEDFIKGVTGGVVPPQDKSEDKPATHPEDDKTTAHAPAPIPLIYKLLFGLALIFGATGIYYAVRVRQSMKDLMN